MFVAESSDAATLRFDRFAIEQRRRRVEDADLKENRIVRRARRCGMLYVDERSLVSDFTRLELPERDASSSVGPDSIAQPDYVPGGRPSKQG